MPLKNLRRNPINSSVTSVAITDESHTVAELDFLTGVYGFILEERPIAGSVTVVTDNTAATPYTIVTTSPLPGQVFVDFNENRGICIFNSADDGDVVLVSYSGAGANNSIENFRAIADEEITTQVTAKKDTSGGFVGLTLFKINFKNALNTVTSFFTNSNTTERTYTFPNKSGTVAMLDDITSPDVAGAINAAAEKTTLADSDRIPLTDSAASFALKWLSFANLKVVLKAYFDTLYAPVSTVGSYYANTQTGYGSTATKIPYFTNEPTNTPNSQFTMSNSATDGLSITILVAGVYSFSFCEDSGGQYIGLSLNASSVTTNIESLAVGEVLCISSVPSGGGVAEQVSITRRFAVNDVIRPHTQGGAAINAGRCNFMCERVAA